MSKKHKIIILLGIIYLIFSIRISKSFSGTLIDAVTGQPAEGVSIEYRAIGDANGIVETLSTTLRREVIKTGKDGKFDFKTKPVMAFFPFTFYGGDVQLVVSSPSYHGALIFLNNNQICTDNGIHEVCEYFKFDKENEIPVILHAKTKDDCEKSITEDAKRKCYKYNGYYLARSIPDRSMCGYVDYKDSALCEKHLDDEIRVYNYRTSQIVTTIVKDLTKFRSERYANCCNGKMDCTCENNYLGYSFEERMAEIEKSIYQGDDQCKNKSVRTGGVGCILFDALFEKCDTRPVVEISPDGRRYYVYQQLCDDKDLIYCKDFTNSANYVNGTLEELDIAGLKKDEFGCKSYGYYKQVSD